jgi:hypothetical protein
MDNREWCSGSGLAISSDRVNEDTSRVLCIDCGREVAVKFEEGSSVREWHLTRFLLHSQPTEPRL